MINGNGTAIVSGGPLQRGVSISSEQSLTRASLDAGLNELGADLADLGGLEALSSGELDDLDPLGVEFDLSHFKDLEADAAYGSRGGVVEDGANGGAAAVVVNAGGHMSREGSFTIAGGGTLSKQASSSSAAGAAGYHVSGGEVLSHQSSLDIHTIMQMVSSDEELKQKEGGSEDAMDVALAFGEGPAKELFGVELDAS